MESCSFAPILAAHFPFWGELLSENRETLCRSTAQVRFAGGTTLHDGQPLFRRDVGHAADSVHEHGSAAGNFPLG